ncbi:MAG: toxin-antitoxin system YwqK family antitoxin [Chitinophagaceae bacterium]
MEKLMLFCIVLTMYLHTSAQDQVNSLYSTDSIGRTNTDEFNNVERTVIENFLSLPEKFSMPEKGNLEKKNTRRNGLYVAYNNRGDTQFVGNYHKGQLNGKWMSWFNNRNVCDSGLLINDLPEGTWKGWYANGSPKYILQFSARKLNALKDELIRQPKTKYYLLANKQPAEASRHYDAQLLFGHSREEVKSISLTKKVNYPVYSLEAVKKIVTDNTDVSNNSTYKAPFAEGLLHGQFTSFYPDGSIKETGLYLNGLREGMWEEFSLSNEKSIGTYRHGFRNGEWRYYNSQGKLVFWKRFDAKGRETEKYSFAGN